MSSITKNIVYNSVTNALGDEKKDLNNPFSFLDYLKYTGTNDKDDQLINYRDYLKSWEQFTNISLVSINVNVKDQFIAFLEEIKLVFLSPEERRYFNNIDLTNDEQLTVSLPFFTTKIKEIALYFKKKRDTITGNLEYIKRKGTPSGAERFIKEQILDIYSGDDVAGLVDFNQFDQDGLNELLNSIDINIERVYDTFNDYYDLSPLKPPSFYDVTGGLRKDYFSSNTNNLSANFYIDEDKAISQVINEQGLTLKEIPGLYVKFDTTDLSFMNSDKFIEYKNTNNRSDLNFNYEKDIAKRYLGTDMYYVSSNSSGDFKYDKLFDAAYPHRNLLNINNPATITIPGSAYKSERDIGIYFKPAYRGILKMETDFISSLLEVNIQKDTLYTFPDPFRVGNVDGLGGVKRENPLTFNNSFNRFKTPSSSFGRFLPEVDSRDQTMHSYNTSEQRLFKANNLSPLQGLETINLSGSVTKETGDIFGNKFYLVNRTIENNKNISDTSFIRTPLGLYDTEQTALSTSSEKETITLKRFKNKNIQVYSLIDNTIFPIQEKFTKIFNRYTYDPILYNQLISNQFQDIDIFKNVYFLRTDNHLIIDTISYSSNGLFTPETFVSLVKKFNKGFIVDQANNTLSNISNPTRLGDELFYIKLNSDPSTTSPVNIKFFQFEIFKYNLNSKKEINLITSNTQNQSYFQDNFTFNVGSNIVEISEIKLSYNSKQEKFICITNFRDLNNVSFLHILIFDINGNLLDIKSNYAITPDNFTNTVNFYTSGLVKDMDQPIPTGLIEPRSVLTKPKQDTTYGALRF